MTDDTITSTIASEAVRAAISAAQAAEKAAVAAAIVGVNIDNIKVNIKEIKDTLKEMSSLYLPKAEFIEHIKIDDDHEKRIREVERLSLESHKIHDVFWKTNTENAEKIDKIKEFQDTLTGKMWGVGVMASTIASIIVIIISHYWK